MKIFIAIVFGRSFSLNVNGADTISTIKRMIQDKNRCLIPDEYVLIYNGAILVDEKALSDYEIVEESIVQLKLQCNKTQQETIEEIIRDLNQIKKLQEATISEIKKITDDFTETSSALKNRVESYNGIIELLCSGLNNAQEENARDDAKEPDCPSDFNSSNYSSKMSDNEQAAAGDNQAQDYIKLKVVGQDTNEIHFRVKCDTSMAKLMKSYADRIGYNVNCFRFLFDGRRIGDEDTPEALKMEDDDVIEVYHRMPCCCSHIQ